MATLLAHIQVRPGMEDRFERVAASLFRATHSEEHGVRRYEYWRGEQAGSYYSLLSFDDFDAFLDHQTSRHHEGASAELREVTASIRLEWVDPLAGASGLSATTVTPLGQGADALRTDYHRRFRPLVADWWLPHRTRGDLP